MAVQASLFPENLGFPFDAAGQFCLQKPPPFAPTEFFGDNPGDDTAGFSQILNTHVEKQRQEIDHYIKLQNENLRMALREQGKQQISTLMKKFEAQTAIMLRQKEEKIAKASKKSMELEIFLRKLETENQIWQRIAQENEAMAMSLNNTLDQMRERKASNSFDDAESCCGGGGDSAGETPARCSVSEQGKKQSKMICRSCNFRNSTVILLPCRHLCCCKDCEMMLDSCPVCRIEKKAIIEALIF